jgi:hypothetical protein
VFTLNPGFEEHLLAGRMEGLLTTVERSGGTVGTLLSDIVAGELAETLCEIKSLSTLWAIGGFADYPREDYEAYRVALVDSGLFSFGFDVTVLDASKPSTFDWGTRDLYRRLLAGVACVLISFIMLFSLSTSLCADQGTRLRVTLLHSAAMPIADTLYVFFVSLVSFLVYSLCLMSADLGAPGASFTEIFNNTFTRPLISCIIYCIVTAAICGLINGLLKNRVAYLLVGSVLFMILGILGFVCEFASLQSADAGVIAQVLEALPGVRLMRAY